MSGSRRRMGGRERVGREGLVGEGGRMGGWECGRVGEWEVGVWEGESEGGVKGGDVEEMRRRRKG